MVNHVTEPTTVQVLVRDSGDPVYWSAKRVTAAENDQEVGGASFEGPAGESGQYTLHAKTTAQSSDEWTTADLSSEDAACSTYMVVIGSHVSDSGLDEVSIMVSHDNSYCEQEAEN